MMVHAANIEYVLPATCFDCMVAVRRADIIKHADHRPDGILYWVIYIDS